eukprot:6143028-Karenia_brevis.AAC.1
MRNLFRIEVQYARSVRRNKIYRNVSPVDVNANAIFVKIAPNIKNTQALGVHCRKQHTHNASGIIDMFE